MTSRLQMLADDLADRIGRAVTVNDKHWHMEVYSPLGDEVDDARLRWIIQRDVPGEVKAWAEKLGLAKARGPVRTPANPALGLDPRVIVPMRYNEVLVGFISIMDRALSAEELRVVETMAEDAAAAKYHDQLVEDLARGRERQLLRHLIAANDSDLRRQAAMSLREEELVVAGARTAVAVVRFLDPADDPARAGRLLDNAVERMRTRISPHSTAAFVTTDHVVIVGLAADRLRAETERVRELLAELAPEAPTVAGIGPPVPHLEDTVASYRQALDACQVAARIPALRGLAEWDQLGVYRILVDLVTDEDGLADRLHPAFAKLLEANGALLHTLETYLDLGGNAKLTAERLVLHRAGLYHRLDRIRDIGEVDLRDGDTRLALHLSIRLARLAGLYDGEPSHLTSDCAAPPVAPRVLAGAEHL